uniref:Uncharacterized protein n=1 Tax=Solanum tuberosum TaxID=4113 RepID=M1AYN7_SOLTU
MAELDNLTGLMKKKIRKIKGKKENGRTKDRTREMIAVPEYPSLETLHVQKLFL